MIVPKKHKFSIREDFSAFEFREFTKQVISKVEQKYGKAIMFEHGANRKESLTGCGVDHAHFHIVPTGSIKSELSFTSMEWKQITLTEISEHIPFGCEYLLYSEDPVLNKGYVHIVKTPESQFFRKAIAKSIGIPNKFSYKKHPFWKNSRATYTALRTK